MFFLRHFKHQKKIFVSMVGVIALVYLSAMFAVNNLSLLIRSDVDAIKNNLDHEVAKQDYDLVQAVEDLISDNEDQKFKALPSFVDYVKEYDEKDLRYRLAQKYPYDRHSKITRKIWQIWQTRESTDDKIKKFAHTWSSQLGFDYNIITDEDIDEFLFENYQEFPEILTTFKKLPMNILRYDFLRYLVLFSEGGIYADIDTQNLVDLSGWLDVSNEVMKTVLVNDIKNITSNDIGFFVGIEGDYDQGDWRLKTCRRLQFCQWTIKSRKGHPILREIIHSIVRITLQDYSERLNHVKIRGTYHTLHSIYTILEWTGPGIFTDSIFTHLNKITPELLINNNPPQTIKHTTFDRSNIDPNTRSESREIGWENFTKISQPVLFDDVLIMPINTFNGFINNLEYPIDQRFTYVKHDFHGSWKALS